MRYVWAKEKGSGAYIRCNSKNKKTWWGGTKLVPTTKAEQRKMKAEILKRNSKAVVLDSKAKRQMELEWIDRIEEFDAFMND